MVADGSRGGAAVVHEQPAVAPDVLTLKWTKPGDDLDTVANWRKGGLLPAGWSLEVFFRAKDGGWLLMKPRSPHTAGPCQRSGTPAR